MGGACLDADLLNGSYLRFSRLWGDNPKEPRDIFRSTLCKTLPRRASNLSATTESGVNQTTARPEKLDSEANSCAPLRLANEPPDFDNLVREHGQRITRLCYRLLGWRTEVEDVVQEAFVAALRGLPNFRGESSPATWLTRIAVNACRAHLRKRWLRLRFLAEGEEPPDVPGTDEARESLMSAERFEQVRAAVRRLPAKYREVVVLRYLEEMSIEQTAESLDLKRGAVEVRLNRARKYLHGELAEMLED